MNQNKNDTVVQKQVKKVNWWLVPVRWILTIGGLLYRLYRGLDFLIQCLDKLKEYIDF